MTAMAAHPALICRDTNTKMNPQSTYPYEEREDFQEWKERELYYEAQASNKPRERKDNESEGDRESDRNPI